MNEIASPPPQRTCLKLVVMVALGKVGVSRERLGGGLERVCWPSPAFAASGPNQCLL